MGKVIKFPIENRHVLESFDCQSFLTNLWSLPDNEKRASLLSKTSDDQLLELLNNDALLLFLFRVDDVARSLNSRLAQLDASKIPDKAKILPVYFLKPWVEERWAGISLVDEAGNSNARRCCELIVGETRCFLECLIGDLGISDVDLIDPIDPNLRLANCYDGLVIVADWAVNSLKNDCGKNMLNLPNEILFSGNAELAGEFGLSLMQGQANCPSRFSANFYLKRAVELGAVNYRQFQFLNLLHLTVENEKYFDHCKEIFLNLNGVLDIKEEIQTLLSNDAYLTLFNRLLLLLDENRQRYYKKMLNGLDLVIDRPN